ncbi:MAG: hypothetical protein A2Y70_06000 [Candidatus Aminicenantes bacterium RBG_13_64_14]|nr:MAG: hypothetical protein A2Y70_06000 [Candidatus Aminicenantes bacterium RBG_13_64_14]
MKVRVEDLHFSYGDFSLRVAGQTFAEARVTSIVGPNGAGKSTFLKYLAAVLPSSRGSVFLAGKDLAALSGKSLAREMGKTVIVTLHTLDMAVKYSDEMMFMKGDASRGRFAAARD